MSARSLRVLVTAVLVATAMGCQGPQRVLAPAGPAAGELAWLTWVLLAGVGVPTLITFVLFGVALWHGLRRGALREDEGALSDPREERWLVAVACVIGLILLGLLAVNMRTSGRVMRPPSEPTVEVEVIARQFWWEFRYPRHGVVTANELFLPVGESVRLVLSSGDVIHSFWVPELHGKRDATPGHVQAFWVKADREGPLRGQCAEFCGLQHAQMAFWVHAVSRERFDAWLAEQRRPARPGAASAEGAAVFEQGGCVHCHAVRGVFTGGDVGAGMAGPDLTHLASRKHIAAASAPLNRESLRSFILDPHVLKPGLRMPPTPVPERELEALLDWLLSLE